MTTLDVQEPTEPSIHPEKGELRTAKRPRVAGGEKEGPDQVQDSADGVVAGAGTEKDAVVAGSEEPATNQDDKEITGSQEESPDTKEEAEVESGTEERSGEAVKKEGGETGQTEDVPSEAVKETESEQHEGGEVSQTTATE